MAARGARAGVAFLPSEDVYLMTEQTKKRLSRRSVFTTGIAALCLCWTRSSHGQARKSSFLGWLSSTPGADPLLEAFRAGLRALGYIEGRSLRVEARSAQDNTELRALARELVGQQVDVLVTKGRAATRAAQEATAAAPVVMAPVDDPYEFVASLSRPTGNITGLALQQTEIDAKQIEILKEMVPALSRLAIFYYYGETYYALESTAHALGIEALWIEIKQSGDLDRAFADVLAREANGLLIVDTGALGVSCNQIADTALARRIPAAGSWRGEAQTSLLLTYAADEAHLQHRAAFYVDRILRGAKPEDLPVEQAAKFDLIVNLKSARELGVTVPASVFLRANEVID
jgi:putative ABC transport system substrate-binding protein